MRVSIPRTQFRVQGLRSVKICSSVAWSTPPYTLVKIGFTPYGEDGGDMIAFLLPRCRARLEKNAPRNEGTISPKR